MITQGTAILQWIQFYKNNNNFHHMYTAIPTRDSTVTQTNQQHYHWVVPICNQVLRIWSGAGVSAGVCLFFWIFDLHINISQTWHQQPIAVVSITTMEENMMICLFTCKKTTNTRIKKWWQYHVSWPVWCIAHYAHINGIYSMEGGCKTGRETWQSQTLQPAYSRVWYETFNSPAHLVHWFLLVFVAIFSI